MLEYVYVPDGNGLIIYVMPNGFHAAAHIMRQVQDQLQYEVLVR